MAKSVQQYFTEEIPGLPDRINSVMPVINQELGNSADRITLNWHLTDRGVPSNRLIELELIDDIAGSGVRGLGAADFDKDLTYLRGHIRILHGEVLDRYLRGQVEKMKRNLNEPIGA